MLIRVWFLLVGASCTLAYKYREGELLSCSSHDPQRTIQIDAMLGQWYIVEIIHHIPYRVRRVRLDHRVQMEACPEVYLSSLKSDHSVLSLSWNEQNFQKLYTMKALDHQHSGSWVSSDGNDYSGKETGNIEVMKAVRDHLVLTFCKVDRNSSELFSAILSRDGYMLFEDRKKIESMLERRNLQEYVVKQTCSSGFVFASTAILVVWTIVALLLK